MTATPPGHITLSERRLRRALVTLVAGLSLSDPFIEPVPEPLAGS